MSESANEVSLYDVIRGGGYQRHHRETRQHGREGPGRRLEGDRIPHLQAVGPGEPRTRQDGIAPGDAFQSICNVVTVEDPVPQARIAEMRGIERANADDVPS